MLYWFNFLEKLIISVSTASSLCEAQASSIQALGSSLVNKEVEGVGCTILSEMSQSCLNYLREYFCMILFCPYQSSCGVLDKDVVPHTDSRY